MFRDSLIGMEQWRDIPGFGGTYQISSAGRVRRAKPSKNQFGMGHLFKASPDPFGYCCVTLTKSCGRHKRARVHVLMLEAFIGPRPQGHDGSHKNGVRTDNRLENLCWETSSDNHRRKLEHGTLQHGEKHKLAKLTWNKVADIRRRIAGGERQADLAREYGVTEQLVYLVKKHKAWLHPGQP